VTLPGSGRLPGMIARLNAPKDLAAGLIFVVFGLGTFLKARSYEIGTAVHMGPGYFPAAVGLVLAAIGLAAIVRGLVAKTPDPITPHRLLPLVLIFAGVLAFSFLLERTGLVIASAVLIGLACFERLRTRPLEVLIIYVVLTAFSAVVFVRALGLQLPLFPWG
jgi:hypothetical protein